MAGQPTAVVTGASRGIGRAITLRLATRYRVVAIARDETQLNELATAIAARGGECRPLVVDLAKSSSIEKALDGLEAEVVVNNAGVITK